MIRAAMRFGSGPNAFSEQQHGNILVLLHVQSRPPSVHSLAMQWHRTAQRKR